MRPGLEVGEGGGGHLREALELVVGGTAAARVPVYTNSFNNANTFCGTVGKPMATSFAAGRNTIDCRVRDITETHAEAYNERIGFSFIPLCGPVLVWVVAATTNDCCSCSPVCCNCIDPWSSRTSIVCGFNASSSNTNRWCNSSNSNDISSTFSAGNPSIFCERTCWRVGESGCERMC